jgi:hypothetical protein
MRALGFPGYCTKEKALILPLSNLELDEVIDG